MPNDNSEDEFLCIWFVVSIIYVLHGNKNIFIVIVIIVILLGLGHRKVIRYIFPDPYFLCPKYLRFRSNGLDVKSKRRRAADSGGGAALDADADADAVAKTNWIHEVTPDRGDLINADCACYYPALKKFKENGTSRARIKSIFRIWIMYRPFLYTCLNYFECILKCHNGNRDWRFYQSHFGENLLMTDCFFHPSIVLPRSGLQESF